MTIIHAFFAFFAGALFASFAQLVADRIPTGTTIGGRSRCLACGHPLGLLDVLPLFGFAVNRGRCRFCDAPIPRSHPVVELVGGLLFSAVFLAFGGTLEAAVACIAIVVLLCESLLDIGSKTVSDRVWIAGSIPLIVIRIIDGTILPHLLSAGLLFSILYLFALVGEKILKKEALGGGDVKLFVFIGFVLTWEAGLLALFFASFLGFLFGIIRNRKGFALPFVPFIFAGVLIAHFAGAEIIAWYLRLLGA